MIFNFLYLVYITDNLSEGKKKVLMYSVYKNITGSIISESFLIALHEHYYHVKYFQSETWELVSSLILYMDLSSEYTYV